MTPPTAVTSTWISPADMTPDILARWHAVQASAPRWASPFFAPEFAQAVSRQRPDLRIWIDEIDGQRIFWPLHSHSGGRWRPVGEHLCDYQGPIGVTDEHQLRATMKRAGIRWLPFDHVATDQPGFARWARQLLPSPAMDLTGGFDAYRARLAQRQGVKVAGVFKSVLAQARRRMEREIGPVQFVACDDSAPALDALRRWKSAQWRRTGGSDQFAEPWVRGVVDELAHTRSAGLHGQLSSLTIGGRLAAVHLGLRCGAVLHSWFPAYDVALATYSPGLYLLLETARAASMDGVTELDLGRGASPYKQRVMTHQREVMVGCASSPAWIGRGLRHGGIVRDAAKDALRAWRDAARGGMRRSARERP